TQWASLTEIDVQIRAAPQFDLQQIVPSSLTLAGAPAVAPVLPPAGAAVWDVKFRVSQMKLQRDTQEVALSGWLKSSQAFAANVQVAGPVLAPAPLNRQGFVDSLWPPNHSYAKLTLDKCVPQANDFCSNAS